MKKILFFIDSLGYGGAEKVLVNLVNNMDKSKYDITLMTIFDIGVNKQYLLPHINYKYIFKKLIRGNVLLCKCFTPKFLYKHLIKDRYDTIISYLEGNTTRILSGCPYTDTKKLAWIHVEMDERTRYYPYRSKRECRDCYAKYDKIVGVSQNVIESYEAHLGYSDKLCIRYNTVDSDYIRAKSIEKIDDISIDKSVPMLVSVGRLIEQKSYKRLLRIHKRLTDEGIKHKLYIIGEGEQKPDLEKYISDNDLSQSAYILGFRDNPWKYVKAADLFVCSSWKEGFSTAVTEALILGVPCISTNCSGAYELLGHNNEYGIVTENSEDGIYEGLYRMLSEDGLLEHYRGQALERGNKFDKELTVKAVEEIL